MALAWDSYRRSTLRDAWHDGVGVVEDRIAWGRLYMEPVELEGAGIEEMVRETYRPPTEKQDQS